MDNDKRKTASEIIAEMRNRVIGDDGIKWTLTADEVISYADRLEVALAREAAPAGNAAAMREALTECRAVMDKLADVVFHERDIYSVSDDAFAAQNAITAALAAPARNCDVYGKRDCVDAFIRDCADGEIDIETATAEQVDEFMREHWFLFKTWLFSHEKEVPDGK